MKKIMLLPLDERPCNYSFTGLMLADTNFMLIKPPYEILGKKKLCGDTDKIWSWVLENAKTCDAAILSIDTLVYSSILSSRLHHLEADVMAKRVNQLRALKKVNPNLKIYAFSLIMRCPQYSSSDEEPDYYETWGKEIFRQGYLTHRSELSIAYKKELTELEQINAVLPQNYLDDYLARREKNLTVNKLAIDLTRDGVLDFLIIPQDDSSPYGFTAKDQQIIRQYIKNSKQQFKVFMYPDADAVENVLAVRYINEANGRHPMVYVKHASGLGDTVVPPFEDRIISETIKYQIMASGGLIASSVAEADIILMVNMPSGHPLCHDTQSELPAAMEYDTNRTQIEQVLFGEYAMNTLKKCVCFADVGYANGGDPELFELLKLKGMLFKVAGYAGWNTSSNTLGTCIPMAMLHLLYGDRQGHLDALALRYVEDIGYMSFVRKDICTNYLEQMNCSYFEVDGKRGNVALLVHDKLQKFADDCISDDIYKVKVTDCYQPWNRMFETAPTVKVEKRKDKMIFVC